jgi:hypothetical protein
MLPLLLSMLRLPPLILVLLVLGLLEQTLELLKVVFVVGLTEVWFDSRHAVEEVVCTGPKSTCPSCSGGGRSKKREVVWGME